MTATPSCPKPPRAVRLRSWRSDENCRRVSMPARSLWLTTRGAPWAVWAAAYRREFDLSVVAVGGSNGKTTTKELIASVLRQKMATALERSQF